MAPIAFARLSAASFPPTTTGFDSVLSAGSAVSQHLRRNRDWLEHLVLSGLSPTLHDLTNARFEFINFEIGMLGL